QDRLASVSDPEGFTESYLYEPQGELKRLTDKLSRQTNYTHDQLGRVLAMIDTAGRSHSNVYTVPTSGAWLGPTLMAGSAEGGDPIVTRDRAGINAIRRAFATA